MIIGTWVYLWALSCSIGLYFCFCARIILSWLLQLCSIIWSQGAWSLQLHFSFSRLHWLFRIFCNFVQIVKSFVLTSVINATGFLIRIALNLQITLAIIAIFTILILPIQDHTVSLYMFFFFFLLYNIVLVLPYINMHPPQVYTCSPSWTPRISFVSILQLSDYRPFAFLARFISR